MKKALIVIAVLVTALGIFLAGAVFAQYQTASAAGGPTTFGSGMMGGRGGHGLMHDYMEQALAEKLDLTEADIEKEFAAGKTMYQIALDHGIAEADIATFFQEVHKLALDKAVAAGALTQAQADAMLQHMNTNGFGPENCPMGGQRPADGSGFRGGRGGMGMMGGWGQQQTPQATP